MKKKSLFNLPNLMILFSLVLIAVFGQFIYSGDVIVAEEQTSQWPTMVVYKKTNCGCCRQWVAYLREKGFDVQVKNEDNMAHVKQAMGIPGKAMSCHTARIGDIFVEGHVTAATIIRALEDKNVAGVAVPGMPYGSPGMGGFVQPFKEVAVDKSGKIIPYNTVNSRDEI